MTILAFLGVGPTGSGGGTSTATPPASTSVNEAMDVATSAPPRVTITSVLWTSEPDAVVWDVTGTAAGVTDPPWKIYVVARQEPAAAEAQADNEWSVSDEVVPEADGTWRALVYVEDPPPGTSFNVQPLLVTSPPSPSPTPGATPSRTLGPGETATIPPTNTEVDPIREELVLLGPGADIVEQIFRPIRVTTP